MPIWMLGLLAKVLRSAALPALEWLCRRGWDVVVHHEEKRMAKEKKKKGAPPSEENGTP